MREIGRVVSMLLAAATLAVPVAGSSQVVGAGRLVEAPDEVRHDAASAQGAAQEAKEAAARAAQAAAQDPDNKAKAEDAASKGNVAEKRVKEAAEKAAQAEPRVEEGTATLEKALAVTVSDLDCWLPDGDTDKERLEDIRLVFGQEPGAESSLAPYRVELPERPAEPAAAEVERCDPNGAAVKGDGRLFFNLKEYTRTGASWTEVLDNRPFLKFTATLPVSVAVSGENALPSDAELALALASDQRLEWYVASLVVLILGLCLLAENSNIVRISGPDPVGKRRPYSLSRLQMAAWFVLVVAAFLEIWILTGARPDVPASILGLMGIAGGTFVGAQVIDTGKDRRAEDQGKPKVARATRGWFWDVLSNAEGVQLHRFQTFVWTLVMIVIFINELHGKLVMTDFTNTQLGLLGISNGLYLGFKFPETEKPEGPEQGGAGKGGGAGGGAGGGTATGETKRADVPEKPSQDPQPE